MPEYLAPAVYVEEVDTGTKPIEGVSTSTAGFIGVSERGPVDVPILVTSFGEYQRWFGQTLDPTLYAGHPFLPHAVDGFFTNGGKRLFVTRILDRASATAARRFLVAQPAAGAPQSQLLRGAPLGAATLFVTDGTGFAAPQDVQIDTGGSAELGNIAIIAAANTIALRLPLTNPHAGGESVQEVTLAAGAADSLNGPHAAGATTITLNAALGAAPAAGEILSIGAGNTLELVIPTAPLTAGPVINLATPLSLSHQGGAAVTIQTPTNAVPTDTIDGTATAAVGDGVAVVISNAGLTTPGIFLRFNAAGSLTEEFRIVGQLARADLPVVPPTAPMTTYAIYTAGSRVEILGPPPAPAAPVILTAPAAQGANVLQVNDRTGMTVGDVIRVGLAAADEEYMQIAALPATLPGTNPGAVVLNAPLSRPHSGAVVQPLAAQPGPAQGLTITVADAPAGQNSFLVADGTIIAPGDLLRIVTPVGGPYYHVLAAAPAAVNPSSVTLAAPLTASHNASSLFALRTPIVNVLAIDAGQWGNRLRVAMERQDPPDQTPILTTAVRGLIPPLALRLQSAAGVEAGTELILTDAMNSPFNVKVQDIDRQNDFLITLEAATPLPASIVIGDAVRSLEHRFVIELLRQPDPANPSRNAIAIDREVFTNLSLDFRHTRYFERVIGCDYDRTLPTTTNDLSGRPLRRSDRRSEGESRYIRVRDLQPNSTGLRVGPQADYEQRPGARPRIILVRLSGGNDSLGTLSEQLHYLGQDDPNPDFRTGLQTLRNVEEISIVAAPGRTSAFMQGALINHCELMRYRFAVLDGQAPPTDTMANIQLQRQQFDTKYAALYHPWLLIPDPYPVTVSAPPDLPIPPSGHVVGVYARTDIERGVHKAPANEVVRGVIGLQRLLNKEQQDILNPYPVNINVIRDFRTNNRGIRVYGGRVITSDSDWKYVNVRRLLIFIEASIDRGLQWVVFEPNAEPLWARVRRAISNFLTLVWRNGALEGTKVEEAYFVKCDRTTMTQTDIDQGRLIVVVGVAPVKPAEFVIVRIGLWTAHAED